MKVLFYLVVIVSLASGCDKMSKDSPVSVEKNITYNMTNAYISDFTWMNPPESYSVEEGILYVSLNKETDFFNNPEDSSVVGTAPFLYKEIEGDFVAKALFQPDFSAQWNAVALMVYVDSLHWIKFAFENSDATGPSIVTVVTNETSDDANGVILKENPAIWIAIARKNNNYSMHWSTDNNDYKMSRLTSMPASKIVNIGMEMQSPLGEKAVHQIKYFGIDAKTVKDLRNINQ